MGLAIEGESSMHVSGCNNLFICQSPSRRKMGFLAWHLVMCASALFWITAACCFVGASAVDSDLQADFRFWSCDDLMYRHTVVHGVVEILGDLLCPDTRVIEVSINKKAVVIVSTSVVHTKGIRFDVPKQTSMSFAAPGLIFEREKDSEDDIFVVKGELKFYADDWLPAPPQAALEDVYSTLRVFDSGHYEASGIVQFMESAITVSRDPEDYGHIMRGSHWVTRIASIGSSPPSAPVNAPKTFSQRVNMNYKHLKPGMEMQWPSSMMASEEGTKLILGADGSLMVRMPIGKDSCCPGGGEVRDQSEDGGGSVLVSLIAADFSKFWRTREGNKRRSEKKGVAYETKVVLSLTEMGGVEVMVDGTKVLSEAGPRHRRRYLYNLFGFGGTRSSDYEMHVVSNGFEVRLKGELVWGKHVDLV